MGRTVLPLQMVLLVLAAVLTLLSVQQCTAIKFNCMKFPFVSPCRGVVSLSAEQHGSQVQKRENKDNSLDWVLVNHSPTTTLLSNLVKRAESRRGNILFSKIL